MVCGTPVAGPDPWVTEPGLDGGTRLREGEELRQITLLFADLVDSMGISDRLDPEEVHELLRRYQAVCRTAIQENGGHVAQYLGDGVMAYFGYPVAHGDDPARAVRAALGILDGLGDVRAHAAVAYNVDCAVRIGLHTGRVVMGELGGDEAKQRLAMGKVPNLAARIQGEATPNTVAVSATTKRLVEGWFELNPLGARQLKGLSEPVQVFQAVRDLGLLSPLDRQPRRTTPFVGRDRELELLRGAWEAAERCAHVATLQGEAGIGKSRLLRRFREELRDESALILECFCSSYHKSHPLWAITAMLERHIGVEALPADERGPALRAWATEVAASGEDAPDMGDLIPLLGTGIAYPQRGGAEDSPLRQRQRSLEALVDWLRMLAKRRRVVLSIEDVHWADPTTLDLINTLSVLGDRAALCVIATTRPEFDPPWKGRDATRLKLDRLDRACSERMITRMAGKPLAGDLLRAVLERAGGVPLFVEELMHVVLDPHHVVDRGDHFALRTDVALATAIPETLDATLMAHLDRLGSAKFVAQVAAVLGREFRLDMLSAVAEMDPAEIRLAVDALIDAGTVQEKQRGGAPLFLFKHALLQDAAYHSLTRRTREAMHVRTVRVLRESFSSLIEDEPDTLAHHLQHAGERLEALDAWMKAGTIASERAATVETIAYLRRALENLDAVADEAERDRTELQIQVTLAPALMITLGWASSESAAASERARELALKLEDYQALYGALWGLWTVRFLRGELPQALEVAAQAKGMAEQAGDPLLLVTSAHAFGFTRYFMGGFRDALNATDHALELFDMEVERAIATTFQFSSTGAIRAFRTLSLWMQGRYEAAAESEREWFDLVDALDHAPSTAFARSFWLYLQHGRRDYDALLTNASTLLALSQREQFLLWIPVARLFIAWAKAHRGDLSPQEAVEEMREAVEAFRATESRIILTEAMGMLADLERLAGDDAAAMRALDEGFHEAHSRHEHAFLPELHRIHGEILFDRGDEAGADEAFDAAWKVAESQGAHGLALRAAVAAAERFGDQRWIKRAGDELSAVKGDAQVDVQVAKRMLLREVSESDTR